MRCRLPLAAIVLTVVTVQPASAQPTSSPKFRPVAWRAITADVVVVGKVTGIEKDAVEVEGTKRTPKGAYRVALVQVEDALAGAAGQTHIKVGFLPPPPPPASAAGPNGRVQPTIARFGGLPELKVGQELVLFLSKHPSAGFHMLTSLSPPIDAKSAEAKAEITQVKRVTAVLANPMTSLKAEKAEDRYFAARVVLVKHTSPPELGGEVESAMVPAEESKLILKGLIEGDWSKSDEIVGGESVIAMLGVQEKDGWTFPKLESSQKRAAVVQAAFVKWLEGPGKDYMVRKYVLKKK